MIKTKKGNDLSGERETLPMKCRESIGGSKSHSLQGEKLQKRGRGANPIGPIRH